MRAEPRRTRELGRVLAAAVSCGDATRGGRMPMSEGSQDHEDVRRLLAGWESDRAAEREVWGGLDDATMARYAAGTATPEQQARVEAAMLHYPRVRELIEDLGKYGDFSDEQHEPGETILSTPAPRRPPLWRIPAWRLGTAAAVFLAVGITFVAMRRWTGRIEVLVAQATWEAIPSRGEGRIAGYRIAITPPRDGVVIVARRTPEGWEVLPGELPVTARRGRGDPPHGENSAHTYGPLNPRDTEVLYLVVVTDIVTDSSARDEVDDTLRGRKDRPEGVEDAIDRLAEGLRRAGHRWVAITPVTASLAGNLDPEAGRRRSPQPATSEERRP